MTRPYLRENAQDRPLLVMGTIMSVVILFFPWVVQRSQMIGQRTPEQVMTDPLYQDALAQGWEAAVAVQTANNRQEWETVVEQWDGAIALLEMVQQQRPNSASIIQGKLVEYHQNREYALLKMDSTLPEFTWQRVDIADGERNYLLVPPQEYTYSYTYPGPKLDISHDFKLENLGYINAILASLDLPPIPSNQLLPKDPLPLLGTEYLVPNYPLGELYLGRTRCGDPYNVQEQYDCFWKITIRRSRE